MIFRHRCVLSDGLCGHPCFYAVQALDHREPIIGSTQCPCRFRQLCAPLSKNVAPNCPTATTPCVALPISLARLSRHNGRFQCPEYDYFTMTLGQADRALSLRIALGPSRLQGSERRHDRWPAGHLDLASSRLPTASQRQTRSFPARSASTGLMPRTRQVDAERTGCPPMIFAVVSSARSSRHALASGLCRLDQQRSSTGYRLDISVIYHSKANIAP